MELNNDQVITNKLHYDNLLEKARELEKEKADKSIKLYVSKESNSFYAYSRNREYFPTYTINVTAGEQVPKSLLEELERLKKEMKDAEISIITKKEEARKFLSDGATVLNIYNKKIEALSGWKKWLLNIKEDGEHNK